MPGRRSVKSHENEAVPTQFSEGDTVLLEQFFNLGLATSRKCDMLREVLGAREDARRHGGRQPHPLFLVELGGLEGGDPLDRIQKSGRELSFLDEKPLRNNGSRFSWEVAPNRQGTGGVRRSRHA